MYKTSFDYSFSTGMLLILGFSIKTVDLQAFYVPDQICQVFLGLSPTSADGSVSMVARRGCS